MRRSVSTTGANAAFWHWAIGVDPVGHGPARMRRVDTGQGCRGVDRGPDGNGNGRSNGVQSREVDRDDARGGLPR